MAKNNEMKYLLISSFLLAFSSIALSPLEQSAQQAFADQEYSIASTFYKAAYKAAPTEEKTQVLENWSNSLFAEAKFTEVIKLIDLHKLNNETLSLELSLQYGEALLQTKKNNELIAFLKEMTNEKATKLKAHAYIALKQYGKAFSQYSKLNSSEENQLVRAKLLILLKQETRAISILQQIKTQNLQQFYLLWAYSQSRQLDNAKKAFSQFQKIIVKTQVDENFSSVLLNYAQALQDNKQTQDAQDALQFLYLNKQQDFILLKKVEFLLSSQQWKQAAEQLNKIIQTSTDPNFLFQAHKQLALIFDQQQDTANAYKHYDNILSGLVLNKQQQYQTLLLRAWLYRRQNSPAKAYQDFLTAGKLELTREEKAHAFYLAAETTFENPLYYSKAILAFELCLEQQSSYQQKALFAYSLTQWSIKKYQTALQGFRAYTRKYPKDLDAQLYLALSLLKAKQYKNGLKALESFIRLNPNHSKIALAYQYAIQESLLQKTKKSRKTVLRFFTLYKKQLPTTTSLESIKDFIVYYQASYAYSDQNQKNKALALWTTSLKNHLESPINSRILYRLAQHTQSLVETAKATLKKTIEQSEKKSLQKQIDTLTQEATLYYTQSIALQKKHTLHPATFEKATIAYQQKRYKDTEALILKNRQDKLFPNQSLNEQAAMHLILSEIYQQRQDYDLAMQNSLKAVQFSKANTTLNSDALGKHADNLYAIAFSLESEEQKSQLRQAAENYHQASQVSKNKMQSLYKEAKCYEKISQLPEQEQFIDKAIKTYRNALKLKIHSTTDQYYFTRSSYELAHIYTQLKRFQSAHALYKNLAALNIPGTADAKLMADEIKKLHLK